MRGNEIDSYTHPYDDERQLYYVPDSDEEPSNPVKRAALRLWKRSGISIVTHAKPESEEEDDSYFDVRISFVPDDVFETYTEPDLPEVQLAQRGKEVWQRSQHKRLWVSLALILLVSMCIGFSLLAHTFPSSAVPSGAQQPQGFTHNNTLSPPPLKDETNFVTAGPTHTLIMAAPVPTYCPTGTILGQGKEIGSFPVWLSGIDPNTDVVRLPAQRVKSIQNWKGWPVHLLLASRYKILTLISLTAYNIYGSNPPLLHDPYTSDDSDRLLIDAKHPMHLLGSANPPNIGTWDITLYLPNAGCYSISGAWGRGHWLINFAAGR